MVHEAQGQLVQEVAADGGLRALPSRYVLKKEQDRPTATVTTAQPPELSIPTVDVSRLADADPDEAAKLRSALQSWGLFAVTGHGMQEPFLDAVLGASRTFFHLPTEAKQQYSNVVDADDGGRKFQPQGYGVDRVDTDEQVLDWCDRLYLQVQPEEERKLRFWPAHPPELSELLHEFSVVSQKVARLVLAAMARSLGFEEGFFLDKVGERMPSDARFTYYPPCPRPDLVHGLKPHTDNSIVTVLLLDEHVGGLQVFLEEGGGWVDVPVLGGGRHQLLVVVGDEMEIMSNAAFRAPVHRVVAPGEAAERVSLAVFYQPEPHRVLEPSPELVDGDRPAMYRRLEAKVFANGFWDAFALGERTIDFLKVKVDVAGDQPAAAVLSGA
ncbi:jasmonate-induced oxygenase 4-like [Lolium rigidum]|uniref:jasmonate-induced oxygenase 4-like n=1 Tax=Lolium rigidum TaxID=89674 RepID=UPI001F5E1746|nr:jasmonate-induced oxygenase 4-like [Lolium rigidum]